MFHLKSSDREETGTESPDFSLEKELPKISFRMVLFYMTWLIYIQHWMEDNLYANIVSQSSIKLKKPRILIWNLSLVTFTSGFQKCRLNKSLPFFLNNYHYQHAKRDSNHALHERDTNHQGASTQLSFTLKYHV